MKIIINTVFYIFVLTKVTLGQTGNWILSENYEFNTSYDFSYYWNTNYGVNNTINPCDQLDYFCPDADGHVFVCPCLGKPDEYTTYKPSNITFETEPISGNQCIVFTATSGYNAFPYPYVYPHSHLYPFTSGMLFRKFKYSIDENTGAGLKFEMNCKIPAGHFNPAFWLWGGNYEIDILESFDPSMYSLDFNYHYNGYTYNSASDIVGSDPFSDGFHVYALEWTTNYLKWTIDNKTVRMINNPKAPYFPDPNNTSDFPNGISMYLIANLGLLSSFNLTTDNNKKMFIDYIKVYTEDVSCKSFVLCDITNETNISGYNIDLAIDEMVNFQENNSPDPTLVQTCTKTINNNETYTATASNTITLRPGFSALYGSNFTAQISPCSSKSYSHNNNIAITQNDKIKSDKQEIQIYPNPTNSMLFIDIPDIIKVNTLIICNMNGQELIRQQIRDSKTQLNVSNLTNGLYSIKLITDKSVDVRKFVKN